MTATPGRAVGFLLLGARHPWPYLERNARVSQRMWLVLFSGFFESLFYLLAIGVGVGGLVGTVAVNGAQVGYEEFVAPAMLAASAMNGAIFETTGNVFFRFRYSNTYDAVLATPLGARDIAAAELIWAVTRGGVYSAAFVVMMVAMGLTATWWAVLLLPAALLVGVAFGALGLMAVTVMKSWADNELVQLAVLPLFLFSATFVPLDSYPAWGRVVVEATPLYQGVDLIRDLSLGTPGWDALLRVAYLVAVTVAGLAVAGRRFEGLMRI